MASPKMLMNTRLQFEHVVLSAIFLLAAAISTSATSAAVDGPRPPETWGFMGFKKSYEEYGDQGRLRVRYVYPDSPAAKSGIEVDDVIVAVNGAGFRFANSLERYEAFSWLRPGDRVELTVLRDGSSRTLELTAAAMPEEAANQWKEVLTRSRLAHQALTLDQLGLGGGVEITVARDTATKRLVFSAEGHPRQAFAHMELYLRRLPPMVETLDELKPGESFGLLVTRDGTTTNLKILESPPK